MPLGPPTQPPRAQPEQAVISAPSVTLFALNRNPHPTPHALCPCPSPLGPRERKDTNTCRTKGRFPRGSTVQSILQRISRDQISLLTGQPRVPFSPARHAWAPESRASVLLAGARECLQSGRDAAAEAQAGADSPHAGRGSWERGVRSGAVLTQCSGSAELAPHCAPLSLLPRRWGVQDPAGSFRGCNSIVIERIHMVWVLFRCRKFGRKRTPPPQAPRQMTVSPAARPHSPARLQGSSPGREERGTSANCSFVRFRVWEAAVRALISAAHYPG